MGLENATVMPTLAVTDIKAAREFYGELLGLRGLGTTVPEENDMVYECASGSYVYIYERETPSGSTATACAFSVDDLDAVVAALRERGVKFEEYDIPEMGIKTVDSIATTGPVRTAWVTDPSGNILAIDNSMSVIKGGGVKPLPDEG